MQEEGSLWIYKVLKNKYKILIYSGDTDGAVNTYGTKRWLQELNWNVTSAWGPWYSQGQIAGYMQSYDGLDFVTVHGAGHLAPQWKREGTTTMILSWMHNEDF